MRFTLLRSSNNTSLIQQQYHLQFQSPITNKSYLISKKAKFFLKTSMQQEQTYITIVGFPDPNYGIKAVNQNKLPSPIIISLSTPLCIVWRSLAFKFISPNTESYIPNWKQFSIDFKGKVNINIWVKYPFSFKRDKKWHFWFLHQRDIILKFQSHQCDRGSMKVMKTSSIS